MSPLVLGGNTPTEASATIQASPTDGSKAQITITLPAGVLGPDPVTLPAMDLTTQESTDVAAWAIRFLLENAGQMPAPLLRSIADALEAV